MHVEKWQTVRHVSKPPPKPLLVYDGDCNFCKYWVSRWQHLTGNTMDYSPLQDPQLAMRFPEISRRDFEKAVHFIEPNGIVWAGAKAVFCSLAKNSSWQWPLRFYRRSRFFAAVTESAYDFVARHRSFFSRLWGTHS